MTYEERLQHYAQMHADKCNDRIPGSLSILEKKPSELRDEAEVTIAAVAEAIRDYSEICKESVSIVSVDTFLKKKGYVTKT